MGSVCSAGSTKSRQRSNSEKWKGNQARRASSSDIAVQVSKAKEAAEGREGEAGGGGAQTPGQTAGRAESPPAQRLATKSAGEVTPAPITASGVSSADWGKLLPPRLAGLPKEMQNLLMGRKPVPPVPDRRLLRLFVAGEETDSEVERTWLTKQVFPGLRTHTEELGFHLHILDIHALQPTPFVPYNYLLDIVRRTIHEDIEIWLVILNNKLGWHLPTKISEADFTDMLARLRREKPSTAQLMSEVYKLDKNNIPAVYCLQPPSSSPESHRQRQALYDELCHIVTQEQDDRYMRGGLYEEVTTALNGNAGVLDNIVVVRRHIIDLPAQKSHPANKRYLDIDSDDETHQALLEKYQFLVNRVERIVSTESILKWSPSLSDMEASQQGSETAYVKALCRRVEQKLKAAISRMVERQTSVDPYIAAGLPTVLCHELLMHAEKQQEMMEKCRKPPPVVEHVLTKLQEKPYVPVMLYGPTGCGLRTVASYLAAQEHERDPSRVVALRFLTLTPESQTVMAALFTVLEQASIIFSRGSTALHGLKSLSCADIISSIAVCSTKESITVILCGLQMSMLKEDDTDWLSQLLPPTVRLVILTSCPLLSRLGQYVSIPLMQKEETQELFLSSLQAENRCLTPAQQGEVMAVLERTSLPAMTVLMVDLALEWTSDTVVKRSDLPDSMESSMAHVCRQAEAVVGKQCVMRILGYLGRSKFGLSDNELEDVLALDDTLMWALYPQRCPQVRRCPLSIWLYFKRKFAVVIDSAFVYGHCVHRVGKQVDQQVLRLYQTKNVVPYHACLAEYFRGLWAQEPKPLPNPEKPRSMKALPCAVVTQPDRYGRHVNCRKFLCLLHHMLQGLSCQSDAKLCEMRCEAAKQHLLDIRWLVTKLDATSLVQLLDDLQMAISTATTMAKELQWLQLLVARNAAVLNVSGLQLHTRLYLELRVQTRTRGADKLKRASFTDALRILHSAIANSSVNFLILEDNLGSSSVDSSFFLPHFPAEQRVPAAGSSKSEANAAPPVLCLDGFFSNDKTGKTVVSISKLAGEVVVWNTETRNPVRTLTQVEKPSDLVFLDDKRAVVLCNRELRAYDLHAGTLVCNIRGMLNIKMPYFQVRDPDTIISLSRNRMSVNVVDINTGQIHATFKAGEDRFLNSLLVSGDGSMLVCGDETQKPFPLLVWELVHSKLLHDLRMAQHEFITSIAAITHNGHYVACACRGLYDAPDHNFVVVYDLTSGQLYRQFRMTASVTALAVASVSLLVVMTLSDGSLIGYDIQSGNCRFHADGVKATYTKVLLSSDETLAVSYTPRDAAALPIACTVALWNVIEGTFVASYTFDSAVTCCHHVAHNNTIMVGLMTHRYFVVLSQFEPTQKGSVTGSENSDFEGTRSLWRIV